MGRCENYGVVPLLHKLSKGEVVEDKAEVSKLKQKYGLVS